MFNQEDRGGRRGTKGIGIAFDQNAVVEAEAAAEVETAGTAIMAVAEMAAGAPVITITS